MGDFIVTLPALALLRKRWPESRIEFVGNATAADLGRREGLIDAVHSQHEARWSGWYGGEKLERGFSGWLADFDLVVSYWPDPDGEIRARFPSRPDQIFLSGAALPGRVPAAAHYAETLRALGVESGPEDYFYRLRQVDAPPRNSASSRLAIHAGSGSPRKNWPLARWRSLCEWLREDLRMELLIVSGEAEPASNPTDELAGLGEAARGLPLTELVARLAECRLFLGHDSGVSHLAAACGTPCVLLFGPTDPAMWAPPAPHVRVVLAGSEMTTISLGMVQDVVAAALADQK